MDGILGVDKPHGWSSFDVIRRLRRQLTAENSAAASGAHRTSDSVSRPPKMGHAGTLDPMATGLVIVLIGKATKQQDRFMMLDKVYQAEITLGATSTTDDAEGDITPWTKGEEGSSTEPDENRVKDVLGRFTGAIEQVPPRHSAVKVEGQRAYQLARNGEDVVLNPRTVTVYDISRVSFEYPRLRFTARVSSGTYLRSLARDIGEALDTGGYLASLRRTRIGPHTVAEAVSVDDSPQHIRARITEVT